MTTTSTGVTARRHALEREAQRLRVELHHAQAALDTFNHAHPKREAWAPRFVEARETLGLSRSMVARISGVSPSTIRHAELGDRNLTVSTVIRIADVLGVSAGWLIFGEEEQS